MIITGISESALAEKIDDIESSLPTHLHLAYLPNPGYIHLRIDAHGHDEKSLTSTIADTVESLSRRLGNLIIAHENLTRLAYC